MKAEVIKNFTNEHREFKKGDVLIVYDESVFFNENWICDVGSPFFKDNLKLLD